MERFPQNIRGMQKQEKIEHLVLKPIIMQMVDFMCDTVIRRFMLTTTYFNLLLRSSNTALHSLAIPLSSPAISCPSLSCFTNPRFQISMLWRPSSSWLLSGPPLPVEPPVACSSPLYVPSVLLPLLSWRRSALAPNGSSCVRPWLCG